MHNAIFPPSSTPITRSYSNAVHPSSNAHVSGAGFYYPHLQHLPQPHPLPVYQGFVHTPQIGAPTVATSSPTQPSEAARLDRLLQESRRELEDSRKRAREGVEVLEQEILVLREQVSQLTNLLKTTSTTTRGGIREDESVEILRGKFEALTKINTTLRNENKNLNFRLKHEYVPLAEYEKLNDKIKKLAKPSGSRLSGTLPSPSCSAALFPVTETDRTTCSPPHYFSPRTAPAVAAASAATTTPAPRLSLVDMKPLDLENLRPLVNVAGGKGGVGVLPRYTARQTARLQAEDEERQLLERRVSDAIGDLPGESLSMEDAVDFAYRLLSKGGRSEGPAGGPTGSIPRVQALRLFRSVCGEEEVLETSDQVKDFARLVLKTFGQ